MTDDLNWGMYENGELVCVAHRATWSKADAYRPTRQDWADYWRDISIPPRVELVLPWPPSINSYWNHVTGKTKTGKKFSSRTISQRGKLFQMQTYASIHSLGLTGLKIPFSLQVAIELRPPTRRKYDVDNFSKCLFDTFTKKCKLWTDDSVVEVLTVRKGPLDKGRGRALVSIERTVPLH